MMFPRTNLRQNWAFLHAALLVVVSSWCFGGKIFWAKPLIALLASPAWLLLFFEYKSRAAQFPETLPRIRRWLMPLLALIAIVIISSLNPSFRQTPFFEVTVYRPISHILWLPSTPDPAKSLLEIWMSSSLIVSAINLCLCVQTRRMIHRLGTLMVANAAILSISGTIQKLMHVNGMFFGYAAAPNDTWFSSFTYHNHWGAFAVLNLAVALGLALRRTEPGNPPFTQTDGPFLLLCAGIIATTTPLSESRSCTVLSLMLLMISMGLFLKKALFTASHRHRGAHSQNAPAIITLLMGLCVVAGFYFIAGDALHSRWQDTLNQLSAIQNGQVKYGRPQLYHDTWNLAKQHLFWGWGLESYPAVFKPFFTFKPGPDGLMNYFDEAHSDWLQLIAEMGFVGLGLLLAMVLIPLKSVLKNWRNTAFTFHLAVGLILIALYAFVEFPLANPAVITTWWILFFSMIRCQQLAGHDNSASKN